MTITEAHAMILAALPREKDGRLRHTHFVEVQSACYHDETFRCVFSVALVPGVIPGLACSRWNGFTLDEVVEAAMKEIGGKHHGSVAHADQAIANIPGVEAHP
jgi:hypothetical protein